MQKRGDAEMWWFLVSALAFVFVIVMLPLIANTLASGSFYTKERIARDIALQINSLYTIPGNAYIINSNEYNYSYYIHEDRVDVYTAESDMFFGSYNYVKSGDNLEIKLEKPKNVVLIKKGSIIEIKEELPNLNYISAPKIITDEKLQDQKILIDPGHGGNIDNCYKIGETRTYDQINCNLEGYYPGDPGFFNEEKIESDITFEIGQTLYWLLSTDTSSVDLSREDLSFFAHISERKEKIQTTNPNIVISIHIGTQNNGVKIYASSNGAKRKESNYLATLIINNIVQDLNMPGSVIFIDVDSLESENPMQILNNNKISLYIEIGSINDNIDQNEISNAIYHGIKEYFNE